MNKDLKNTKTEIRKLVPEGIVKTLIDPNPPEKIEESYSVDNWLDGFDDHNRDILRDFMSFMIDGFDKEKHLELYNEEIDEVEYYRRVYKYYVWDVIWNHHLINLLIEDRAGRLEKSLSEMKCSEFTEELYNSTTYDYNERVLGKKSLLGSEELMKKNLADIFENIEYYNQPLYVKIERNSDFC